MSKLGFDISELGQNLSVYTGTKILEESSSMLDGVEQTATGAVNALNALLNAEMQALISKGIDSIYESVGLTDSNIAFAKTLLGTVGGAIAKVDSILSVMPEGVTCIPTVKDTMSALCTSFKEVAYQKYADMQLIYALTVNIMLIQLGEPMELLVGIVFAVVEQVEQMVDLKVYQYTGYHILEIYNLCVKGKQLIDIIRNINKVAPLQYEVSADVEIDLEQLKQDRFNNARNQLYSYLDSIATPLYNAFMLLQLKETVQQMRATFEVMTNIDIKTLAYNIQSIEDVVNIIDESMGPNPITVSLSDITVLGLNNITAAAASVKEALNQAANVQNMMDMNQLNAGQLIGSATSTLKLNVSVKATYEVEVGEVEPNGTSHFKIKLSKNPADVAKGLYKVLRNIKYEEQQILPNTEIDKFLNKCQEMWFSGTGGDITLTGMIQGYKRLYVFHIVINKPTENNKEDKKEDNKYDINLPDSITDKIDHITDVFSDLNSDEAEVITDGEKQKIVFDIVFQVLGLIKPVLPTLKIIAHLIENYKINKAKCKAHANGLLHISLLNSIQNLGLEKLSNKSASDNDSSPDSGNSSGDNSSDNTEETGKPNFYTVRTYKLNKYLNKNFILPDNTGTTTITAKQTGLMVTDCKLFANFGSLDVKLQTILYFDSEAIREDERIYNETMLTGIKPERNGKAYKDGTTNGIDRIELDRYTGDIYISKKGLSTETSEIYRCIRRQYDYRK